MRGTCTHIGLWGVGVGAVGGSGVVKWGSERPLYVYM